MAQLSEIIAILNQRLKPVSETALLDAQVLAAFVLERPRSWVLAHPEVQLSPSQLDTFNQYGDRLANGEPLPYILGWWEFFGLDFIVSPDTLIPRPETELLVERALVWLESAGHRNYVADIGTGCGCIGISLAVNFPGHLYTASDISLPALKIARQNASKHGMEASLHFMQADLIPPLDLEIDLLCANLPYIPTNRLPTLKVTQWEPEMSLDGGPDGLDHIRKLLLSSRGRLSPVAGVLLEIDNSHASAAVSFAREIYPMSVTQVIKDLSGQDRLLSIQLQ